MQMPFLLGPVWQALPGLPAGKIDVCLSVCLVNDYVCLSACLSLSL